MTILFSTLRDTNSIRCKRWHPNGIEEWSVNDWLAAMGGEAGEALNAGKKHRRLLSKMQQHGDVPDDLEAASDRIVEELADTVIYADLCAQRLGRDLAAAIVTKFNAISEREGFPERLSHISGCVDVAELTAKDAEITRLKQALQEIAQGKGPTCADSHADALNCIVGMRERAEAALAGKGGE